MAEAARASDVLTPEQRKQVLDCLIIYYSNSEINGTIANIPKEAFSQDDWAGGWIPSRTLASFKRIAAITKNPFHIVEIATTLAPILFETDISCTKLRRRMPFEAKDAAAELAKQSISHTYIEATGFARQATSVEVRTYFSRIGEVKSVVAATDGAWKIEFSNPEDIVKVLAQTHTYEDSPILVFGRSRMDAAHTQILTSTGSPSTLEQHTNLSYPRNRVIEIAIPPTLVSITKLTVKSALENFGAVSNVDLEKDSNKGYIRFKSNVAADVMKIIQHQGGLEINGESVVLRKLEGDEERLYWSVSAAKAANEKVAAATQVAQPVVVKTQGKLAQQRKQRRQAAGPYNKKNKNEKRKTAKVDKKAKVDDLDALFKGWGTAFAEKNESTESTR
ncbi:hypothetical protein HDU85_004960 [Gaertneriomyces sp. JEL0708]|nr:hypothetical protein HDU85_004960 [Gaertneriomyces sp. JEL0708]